MQCTCCYGFWRTVGVFMMFSLPDLSLPPSGSAALLLGDCLCALRCIADRGQVGVGSQKHCYNWFMEKRKIISRTELSSYITSQPFRQLCWWIKRLLALCSNAIRTNIQFVIWNNEFILNRMLWQHFTVLFKSLPYDYLPQVPTRALFF